MSAAQVWEEDLAYFSPLSNLSHQKDGITGTVFPESQSLVHQEVQVLLYTMNLFKFATAIPKMPDM